MYSSFLTLLQEGNIISGPILTFATPIVAIWKIVVQTTGELDTVSVFVDSPLLYPILTYSLFVLFIIAMPLLFNNFLVSL